MVTDPKLRQELRPYAWNQPQTTEASHLIVMCGLVRMDEDHLQQHIRLMAAERQVPEDSFKKFSAGVLDFIKKQTPEEHAAWIDRLQP